MQFSIGIMKNIVFYQYHMYVCMQTWLSHLFTCIGILTIWYTLTK